MNMLIQLWRFTKSKTQMEIYKGLLKSEIHGDMENGKVIGLTHHYFGMNSPMNLKTFSTIKIKEMVNFSWIYKTLVCTSTMFNFAQ